ncbi:MAG: hypothetical protein ABIJ26_01080, partial [Candidatus Margulisiibacteriota bacterium]
IKFRVLLAVLVLVFGGFCLFMYSSVQSPTLQAVLAGEKKSFDYGFVIFGLFAFSLATLSLAKSYELLQNKSTEDSGELKKQASKTNYAVMRGENERLIELNKNLDERLADLKKDRNSLIQQLKKFEEAFKERVTNEEFLKKTVGAIKKENQKLEDEKNQICLDFARLQKELEVFTRIEIEPVKKEEAVKKSKKGVKTNVAKKTSANKKKRSSTKGS